MSTRLKVLCAVLVVGAIAGIAMAIFGDGADYWKSKFVSTSPPPSATRPKAATRPAARPPNAAVTLLRELPRQAVLIAAVEAGGAATGDRSVDFTGTTPEPPLTCEVYQRKTEVPTATVTIADAGGKTLREIELPIPSIGGKLPDYAAVVTTVETWIDAEFAPLLAGGRTSSVTRPAANPSLAVPPDVESLLTQIDPQRAFLAAQQMHRVIAESGESPQRLAALARAYAHLGESTRYLYSRHGDVFFARSLLYSHRLVRKHPDLPLSHAARGYALALLGQPPEARRAFEKARQLAGDGNALPAWAALADDLARFRTGQLFARTDPEKPEAPLAAYFAMLSVEHSGLQSAVINLSRTALVSNPGAMRLVHVMTDNSGVGLQHESTIAAVTVQFGLLAKLAETPGVPEAVQAAARDAATAKFTPAAVPPLMAAMDGAKPEPGQPLTWSTYAAISRDALFVSGIRRIYFTASMLAVDPSKQLAAWWPMLKDHRLAPVLAGFDRSGKINDDQAATVVARGLDPKDFYFRLPRIAPDAKRLGAPGAAWSDRYEYTNDNDTIYDRANTLWAYRSKAFDALPMIAAVKGELAETLAAACPDHPVAVAELVVNRWPQTKARAAEIERELGGHPQVALALARAYRSEGRVDDALRLIERVIGFSPDAAAYEELAGIYRQQGDEEKWLAAYEKYFETSEDFGLDHARKNEEIAYALMRKKQHQRALKYAEAAGESYAQWGLTAYASCLTELGRYDEAEQISRATQARYPNSLAWYRWCRSTGRGDLPGARSASEAAVAEIENSGGGGAITEAGIFNELEGRPDRARQCWERALNHQGSGYYALQLALFHIERNDSTKAGEALEAFVREGPRISDKLIKKTGNVTPSADEAKLQAYGLAAEELTRCIADPAALPRRDGEVKAKILDASGAPFRGTIAYSFGRLCELRGKKEDAVWWYRQSLDGEWTHSARPQAGAGLTRLGETYYKASVR